MKIYLTENTKKYRKQLGLSQRELSKISGVPLSMITKIEQGVSTQPTIQTVAKIAEALKLSIDKLIVG